MNLCHRSVNDLNFLFMLFCSVCSYPAVELSIITLLFRKTEQISNKWKFLYSPASIEFYVFCLSYFNWGFMVPYDCFHLFLDLTFAWFVRLQEQSWGEGTGWSVWGGKGCSTHNRKLSNCSACCEMACWQLPSQPLSWVGTSLSACRAEILAPGSSCLD